MAKAVMLRQLAAQDIDAAVAYYQRGGGAPLAVRFIDAVEQALGNLAEHPLTGSLRLSYELDLPGLRAWPLASFPYLVFYVDRADAVDVWRILQAHRDLPAWLAPPDAGPT